MLSKGRNSAALKEEVERLRYENQYLSERLGRITEITAAIIYILDVNGHFVFINKAVDEILHYKPEELIVKHFSTIMSREEYDRVARAVVLPKFAGKKTGVEKAPKLFDERRTGERRTKNLEVRLVTKGRHGIKILVGDVTGIIAVEGAYDRKMIDGKNHSNAFLGSQGIIFDITKYKKAEKERMELQRRLFETQKMDAIGRLSGKVAHDLNNKLGSILGCAEIMRQDFISSKEEMAYIDTIISASKHAAELSNRLMEFSRKDDHTMIKLSLNQVVENVLELVKPTIEGSIIVTTDFSATDFIINGNPNHLQNAILNVVTNACDAMPFGTGDLKFATRNIILNKEEAKQAKVHPGKFIILSISDTGIGMDKETQDHLFQPFFTTKAVGKGLGLGLASVRDCIKSHGGYIEFESSSGKGSDFRLIIPVVS